MDNAIGMKSGYANWKDTKLMQSIKPCLLREDGTVNYYIQKDNYTLKEGGGTSNLTGIDGDVMVEIPLMGYKMWNDDTYQYISVTMDPDKEKDGYCYYAHSLDNEKDCDKIYMGAYLGYKDTDNRLYSRSGVSPTVNTNLIDFRISTVNKGKGYSLTSFFPHTLLQCLYVIIYKNLNSQSALGQGYTSANNSSKKNTGGTNSNTFCYGTTSDTQQIKLFGIEDFYGNLLQRLDGLYCDSNHNIKTDYRNSVFTVSNGNSFQFSTKGSVQNWYNITKILGTNTSGFVIKNGYDTNRGQDYYCDYGDLSSGCFGVSGGYWDDGSGAGVFQLDVDVSASNAYSYVGARLMYKHQRPESAPPPNKT